MGQRRPNFIFILADDLGYADLGCYGGRDDTSPVIDQMARGGLHFTYGYANSSVCSPTRFALATGRWQHRLRGGADEPLSKHSGKIGLPPEHPTLASLLRDSGYRTALIGKWHLGQPPYFGPRESGYQHFFGHLGGAVDYFRHQFGGKHDLWEDETEVFTTGYLTDILSEKAADFVRGSGKEPFLLSLHYNAPHWPWETRSDEAEAQRIENIVHTDGGSLDTYLTMIRQMDEGIGAVLDAVDELGARDETLVVFTSDNGGERFSNMWPLMGQKMDLMEGGIRVPYVVRWPGRVEAGGCRRDLVITMDWVATFLSAAGVAPDPSYPLDGIDLFGPAVERALFWRMKFRKQKAARRDQWKYLSIEGDEFLFDVEADPRERANLRYREPRAFDGLRAQYLAWEASLPPIPEDARYSLPYSRSEVAHPS